MSCRAAEPLTHDIFAASAPARSLCLVWMNMQSENSMQSEIRRLTAVALEPFTAIDDEANDAHALTRNCRST